MNDLNLKPKKLNILKITGKIIKWTFLALILFSMIWCFICSKAQKGTALTKRYTFTKETSALYLKSNSLTIWDLTSYIENDSEQSLIERLFFIQNINFTEENSEFQFTLRYNTKNQNVANISSSNENGEPFVFILKDNLGNIYNEYYFLTDSSLMYRFYRIIFQNVDTSKATQLKLYIYRNNEENTEQKNLIDICTVWYSDSNRDEHKLTSDEKKYINNLTPLSFNKTVLKEKTN